MNDAIKTATEGLTADQTDFIEGYVIAALWSSTTEDDDELNITDETMPDDIADETMQAMVTDCLEFLSLHGTLIDSEPNPPISNDGSSTYAMAGHDFWLTRCGHGAGFWDGDWPVNGDKLTQACGWQGRFGNIDLYVGDDGLVYQ